MASQMLASVKGMSACTHTERGERVHDRGFLWGFQHAAGGKHQYRLQCKHQA
jgi:hypothetical protein